MILIVGQRADPHVASVVRSLQQHGYKFAVLDFFGGSSDGLCYDVSANAAVDIAGPKLNLREFTSVWWRQKPKLVVSTSTPTSLYDYFFIKHEWKQLTDFLDAEMTSVFSINDPQKAAYASNKLAHLKVGIECGFVVPESLISNDAESISDFVSRNDGSRFIYKPLTPYMPPSGLITFTSEIDLDIIRNKRQEINAAPGIFQAFVEKQFELRITVVGTDVFAARVNSHHSTETEIDWRRETFADMYSPHELEAGFLARLLTLHKKFGLFYAAYDFIIDKAGVPVLLDVNPAGQWMWIEERLGFPIGERIAMALANPSSR